jgi:hypothetical protein
MVRPAWNDRDGSFYLPVRLQMMWRLHTTYSEVEVVVGEVFRAPGWSAGLLHLHFSVARSVPVGGGGVSQ